jgi:hypothetical protein
MTHRTMAFRTMTLKAIGGTANGVVNPFPAEWETGVGLLNR